MVQPAHAALYFSPILNIDERTGNLIIFFDRIENTPAYNRSDCFRIVQQINEWLNQNHQRITRLDVSNAGIAYIPKEIEKLTELETIDLSGNQIATLKDVSFPDTLESLSLANNLISDLEDVALPFSLRSLNLNNNSLTSIDPVLTLSCNSTVFAKNNRFTIDYLFRLKQLRDKRCVSNPESCPKIVLTNPDSSRFVILPSLRGQFNQWIQEFFSFCDQSYVDVAALFKLDAVAQDLLNASLERCWEEMQNASITDRRSAIWSIVKMLESAAQDDSCQSSMLQKMRSDIFVLDDAKKILSLDHITA